MGPAETLLFAFLAGLTVAGFAASVMEFFALRTISFREPFVSPDHIARSMAVMVAAGPFMLLNDALAAHREERISSLALASCACASCAWALASGIVLLGLASAATYPLT